MSINPQPKPETTRLKGLKYKAFREQVFQHYEGICAECGDFAPLYDYEGVFDIWVCGHVAHIKSRGAGGGDVIENVRWKCPSCHLNKEHSPRWSRKIGG